VSAVLDKMQRTERLKENQEERNSKRGEGGGKGSQCCLSRLHKGRRQNYNKPSTRTFTRLVCDVFINNVRSVL
jgi:hypothetical protein